MGGRGEGGVVTEWVLSVCLSNVAGQSGCTIIVDINFLLASGGVLLCPQNNPCLPFASMVKEIMVQGNILHQWLGSSNHNFSAAEVIQHPLLGINAVARGGVEYQFTSFQQFAVELPTTVTSQQRKQAAIILPPDKSMLLLIGEIGHLVPLESL